MIGQFLPQIRTIYATMAFVIKSYRPLQVSRKIEVYVYFSLANFSRFAALRINHGAPRIIRANKFATWETGFW